MSLKPLRWLGRGREQHESPAPDLVADQVAPASAPVVSSPGVGLSMGYVARVGQMVGSRSGNQDRALVAGPLLAVADGIGGSVRGDAAAQVALGRIAIDGALLGAHVPPETAVRALVQGAHEQALHAAQVFGAVETSSTLVLVHLSRPSSPDTGFVDPDHEQVVVTCGWVGDSLVLLSDGSTVEQLTVAHTSSPSGNANAQHPLVRAIGGVDGTADVVSRTVSAPSRLALASDGLLVVPPDIVAAVLNNFEDDAAQCVAELLTLCDHYGVRDNATLLVVDLVRPTERRSLTDVL